MKLLSVDLVILNERPPSYAQELHASVEAMVRASQSRLHREPTGVRGTVFVLRADLVSVEVRTLLQSVARAVLLGRRGSLSEQLERRRRGRRRAAATRSPPSASPEPAPPRPELEFWNGLGGFAAGGREYVTILGEGQWTPAPWINVIANPASASRRRSRAAATRGPATVARTSSRPGRTIPSATARAKCSTCATKTTACCSVRPRSRFATRPDTTSHGTARATAASSTPRTASRSSCSSTSRSATRSRSRA